MISEEHYKELEYSTVASLYDIHKIGELVKVRVIVAEIGVPTISNDDLCMYVIFESPEGGQFPSQIASTAVRGEKLIRNLVCLVQPTQLADVLGVVATVSVDGEEEFAIYVAPVGKVAPADYHFDH